MSLDQPARPSTPDEARPARRWRPPWSGRPFGGADGDATRPRPGVVSGRARVDKRTKVLLGRLVPGEVAVVDHEDLDRVAAEGLIRAQAGAVVNASASISGRYPNVGPLLLAAAGIPLVDDAGPEVMTAIREGDTVEIDGGDVRVGGQVMARGTRQTMDSLELLIEAARQSVGDELERFAANTLEYLREERHLLTHPPELPGLRTEMAGRHVLIVVRGPDAASDLAALGSYIAEMRPVLVGVDGGADVLLSAGHRPDIVIGDFDSVSTEALQGGNGRAPRRRPELVVHAYRGGRAPGAARLDALGLDYLVFEVMGTSEDAAMILAYEKRAELIVAVGTHASAVEFLDKGRAGMASTFLVRLKVGPILVDAKGVSRLYQSRVRTRDMVFLVAAALFAMLVMVALAQPLQVFVRALWFLTWG